MLRYEPTAEEYDASSAIAATDAGGGSREETASLARPLRWEPGVVPVLHASWVFKAKT
jgi:hypothetical protein